MTIKAIRKGMLLLVKFSWRSARRHPLVIGLILFMLILYRYFPSLFAFIIYSSPVIGCTGLLLGAILVYGEPAASEAEDVKSGDVSLEVGSASGDIVKTGERFFSEMNIKNRGMSVTNEGPRIKMHDEVDGKYNSISAAASSSRNADKKFQGQKTVTCQLDAHDLEFVEKKVFSVEKQTECPLQIGEGLKLEINKVSENQFESSLGSPWQQISSHDISSGSESDQEYSLSPSETTSDIIPIIDELHPLLESDNPQTSYRSADTSDAVSRASSPDHESDGGSLEGETENQVDEEDEEPHEEKDNNDDVMKWTADDQKNLMDLGSSELERNQRLENLIAKRRARKLQRFQTDKNLIDLDNEPLPFMEEISGLNVQLPAISAPRHNPFDVPYDSEKSTGLPPIPGSAPSVLLPRMNPFDIPYNLHEQNSSLNAESSRSYGVTDSQKDLLLGRNERLQSGAASLEACQENHEIKLKPFFVAENMSGTGFVSFERQLSEKSDSRESSTSETDSNSSVGNVGPDLSEKVRELKLSENHGVELVVQECESSEEDGSFDLEQELTAEVGSEEEVGSSSAVSSATNLEVIEESYDGSGSSYGSEGIKKYHETIHAAYTEDDCVGRSAQPSPSVVEPGITTKVVEGTEDSHVADPVYDSSPSSKSVAHVPSLDEAFLSESKGKEGFNTQSTSEKQADLHKADTTLLEGSFVQVSGNIDAAEEVRYIDGMGSDKESNGEKLKVSDGLSDDVHPEVNEVSDSIVTNFPLEELKTHGGIQSLQPKSTSATVAGTQLNSTTSQYLVEKLTTEFDTDAVSSSVPFSEESKIENPELSQIPETSSPHKTDPIQKASVESVESFTLQPTADNSEGNPGIPSDSVKLQ